jgi:hypothetical protein
MSAIELYWLPLGAGGHSVRLNGLVFEAIAARFQHRGRDDLYHSALEVHVPEGRFVIEQAPAWGTSGERGVVAEGPVGIRAAGRFRLFRYEVRRWRDGVAPADLERWIQGSTSQATSGVCTCCAGLSSVRPAASAIREGVPAEGPAAPKPPSLSIGGVPCVGEACTFTDLLSPA